MDITSATVKLLELEHRAGGLRIDSYAVRPLREGAVVERRIRDKSEVVDTLGRAVDHARLQSRRAVIAERRGHRSTDSDGIRQVHPVSAQ